MRATLFSPTSVASTSRLLLFFNGWAMTPASIEHIAIPEGFDLLVIGDYRNDNFSFDFSLLLGNQTINILQITFIS